MTPDPEPAYPITADELASLYRIVGLEPPRYTRDQVEQLSHIDRERALRWWRAMGFPEVGEDVVGFGESDVVVSRRLGELIDEGLVDDSGVLRLARLMGSSFSRIAEAQLGAVDSSAVEALLLGADQDLEGLARARLAALESSMLYVWRRHLLAALGQRIEAGSDVVVAVGFADITGFTRMTKRLSQAELADIVDYFESAAFDVVTSYGGRVVKLIGDEVMYTSVDPADAVRIGLDLIDRAALGPRPVKLHCGVAWGATVDVGGDVFGSTVNLASRLTTLARPDTVVVPRDLGKRLAKITDLAIRPSRQIHDLKGIGPTRISAVRRAGVDVTVPTGSFDGSAVEAVDGGVSGEDE